MKQNAFQRNLIVCAAIAAMGLSAVGVKMATAADKEDSEIAVVMKKNFKGKTSIFKKATDGTATKEELTTLLEGTKTLQKAKPPKGEQQDWDERTAKLQKATDALLGGDKAAIKDLKSAGACKDCHKLHQPE